MSISKRYMLDIRARRVAVQGFVNGSDRTQALAMLVVHLGTGPFTIAQVKEIWVEGGPGFERSATPNSKIAAFIKNGYFQEVQ